MRILVVILLVLTPMIGSGQKEISLKKKFFGTYVGSIPSYKYDNGSEIIEVSSTDITVIITSDKISVAIGNNKISGSYDVMFEAKSYYLLDAKMEGQLATERIMVYKTRRHISRDGMYPQPVTELKRTKH